MKSPDVGTSRQRGIFMSFYQSMHKVDYLLENTSLVACLIM